MGRPKRQSATPFQRHPLGRFGNRRRKSVLDRLMRCAVLGKSPLQGVRIELLSPKRHMDMLRNPSHGRESLIDQGSPRRKRFP